jgi:cobalt transporter subunit CbtA|tara:strand:- start:219 stop:926 length:708 start_codon:yes stop_codon:yes gene_type:complete
MFNKYIYPPILTGVITGLIISIISIFVLYPIIHEAELLETSGNIQIDAHVMGHLDDASHEHIDNQAVLKYFQQRNFITLMVNICITVGYAFVIIGLTNLLKINIRLKSAMAIGLVGFICFYLLPSIALIPQLPGAQYTQGLYERQLIWLSIVFLSLIGFIVIYINSSNIKRLIGLVLVFLPLTLILILNDNISMEVSNSLHYKFIYYTFFSNLIMWFTIAITINFIMNRKVSYNV